MSCGVVRTYFNNGPNFSSGDICEEYFIFNNKKEGPCKYYYTNNILSGITNYVNGCKHGESFCYFKNGMLKEYTEYYKDELHGKYEKYNSDGSLSYSNMYKHGKIIL